MARCSRKSARDSDRCAPAKMRDIASAGRGMRVLMVRARACERAIPLRTSATRWPWAGLSKPKSACMELMAERYGCRLVAATVPFSAT
eukprot:scaffold320876_cov31-Tisochrysis_lutea.AAC.1